MPDVSALLDAANGFSGLSATQRLAVQVQLLCDITSNLGRPAKDCNVSGLLADSARWLALDSGQNEIIQAQLLSEIATGPTASCDTSTLLSDGALLSLEPGQLEMIKTQLLCQIAG